MSFVRMPGFRLSFARVVCAILAVVAAVFPAAFSHGAENVEPARKQSPAGDEDFYEGPAKKPRKPAAKPAAVPNIIAAPAGTGPLWADVWPSEPRMPEADLALADGGKNRARAMAEFAKGLAADATGDAELALAAWQEATGLDPADAELAVKVAFELAKRNEPGEAIRVLKDSIAAAPKEPRTRVYLSQVYARHLNKPDLAMKFAEEAVAVAPEYAVAWTTVLDLLKENGEEKKAADFVEKVIQSGSKDAKFWIEIGNYLMRGVLEGGGDAKPDEEQGRRMERVFRRAAELAPDDAATLTKAGDFYTLMRDEKRALEMYERAVKLGQAPVDEATQNLREKHIRALANAGRAREAIPLLEQFVKEPGANAGNALFEYLGELYEQTGQPEKAIEQYRQSLALDGSDPRNHLNLADAQLRAKLYDEALETIEKARRRFPDNVSLMYAVAQVLGRAKRHDDALAVFAKLEVEAKGRNEDMLDQEFYFYWGAAAEQAKKFDIAEEKLRKSIEIEPEQAEANNYLGYMLVDRGQKLEEAAQMIRKALDIRPNEGAYLDSLGWYYFKAGKYEEAKRELLNAINALREEDAVVYDHLADTYEKLGDKTNAIKYWERALKLEPEDAAKIQAKIEAVKR